MLSLVIQAALAGQKVAEGAMEELRLKLYEFTIICKG